ncbi:MAG TPA: CRTAC1 family protein, partial [Planctomycetaceae bacterium]|nr:CRTAC1 family protein [Planctomycetaceae bacterium]
FRNSGNGRFVDTTANTGLGDQQYSQGCAAGGYNNDGFADLALANFGTNVIYRNNGDGTFSDATAASGIGGEHWSTSLAWSDLDRDGELDLYVVNYVLDALRVCRSDKGIPKTCHVQLYEAEHDVLYLSRGDGAFDDVTDSAGIRVPDGKGLGVVIADLDDDGWPDVYVSNDGTPNFLFHNLGSQTGALKFSEVGLASGAAVGSEGAPKAGMGIACADFDGDGRLDLHVTNFYREGSTLYLNRGDLLFEDGTQRAGLVEPTKPMLGWGTQAIDLDLDGRSELFVSNGYVEHFQRPEEPWPMPPQLFYNQGEGRFAEISRASGEFFAGQYLGRGAARIDWDRDGRPDLIVVHQDRPVALLHNETQSTGRRLILLLHGVESNRDAIGARIRATSAGTAQMLEICGGDGYCASNDRRQIVGLGQALAVDVLEIDWPSGRKDRLTDIPADVELILIEGRPAVMKSIEHESK